MKVIDGGPVEDAVLATLKAWLPWHLAQIEHDRGLERGQIGRPVRWEIVDSRIEVPISSTPLVVIESPGLEGARPTRGVSFDHHATWRIAVWTFTTSTTRRGADVNARIYAAAIRAALVLHPDLDGFASGVEWVDENYYDEGTVGKSQFLAISRSVVNVQVHEVLSADDIPRVPPPDPLAPPPDAVESRTVTVTASDTGQSVTVEAPEEPDPEDP